MKFSALTRILGGASLRAIFASANELGGTQEMRERNAPRLHASSTVKKNTPFGRYIKYRHVRVSASQEYHFFLHATKGWRQFQHLPYAMTRSLREFKATEPAL